jgi:hypothetical protein
MALTSPEALTWFFLPIEPAVMVVYKISGPMA